MKQALLKKRNTYTTCWLKDDEKRSIKEGFSICFLGDRDTDIWKIVKLYSREMTDVNSTWAVGGLF